MISPSAAKSASWILLLLVLLLVVPQQGFAQRSPLIMKHADNLDVSRRRGYLLLQGRVHFVHDSIQLRTQRATWNKEGEVVTCEGGFLFTHPSGWIDAHSGIYQKRKGLASATGDVHAGDSARTYYATGEYVVYDKENEILTMPEKPRLYHYEKLKDGTMDTITIVARRMIYNKRDAVAEAHGQASITEKDVVVKADDINYDRKRDYAQARGGSSITHTDVVIVAEDMDYDRKRDYAEAHKKVTITHKDIVINADHMNYDRKNDFAEAFDHVKVTQKEMVVTCDTGYFDRKNNWMSMKGHPTCDLKNYHLTGDSIFLVLDSTGKSLKSALVIRNAHGIQKEEPKKGSPGNVTEAFGDTLYAQFDGNKIERLYVNLNAHGFFYEMDLQDYRNLMNGDRLDIYFKDGKMDYAVVSGKAQSTYYYVKKDRSVAGLNEAAGDTIFIKFDPRKNAVKTLRMLGGSTTPASGRYVDLEKENRSKSLSGGTGSSDSKDGGAKAPTPKPLERPVIKESPKPSEKSEKAATPKSHDALNGMSDKFNRIKKKVRSEESK